MKILMLTCNASLLDGINRHILTVAPALQRLGAEVAVCTTHPAGELNAELEKRGVQTFSLNAPHGHALPIVWRFWRVIRRYRPDILHGHVTSLLVGLVGRMVACRYVETVHGIADPGRSSRRGGGWGRLFRPPVWHTCYISEGVRAAANAILKTSVVYNPLSLPPSADSVGVLQRRLGLPVDTRCIGTSCRLAAVKDPEAFIRVFCLVLERRADIQAVVMGDGDADLIQRCRAIVWEKVWPPESISWAISRMLRRYAEICPVVYYTLKGLTNRRWI